MTEGEDWYRKSETEAIETQQTALDQGISHEEVVRRRITFGNNVIQSIRRRIALKIFLSQFTDFLVVVLIGAAIIASFLGEPQNTIAIIIMNAVLSELLISIVVSAAFFLQLKLKSGCVEEALANQVGSQ